MPINDGLSTLIIVKMEKRRFKSRSRSSGRFRYPEAKPKRRDASKESSSHSNSSMEIYHKQLKQILLSSPVEHPDITEERKSETSHEKVSPEELIVFSDEAEQEKGEMRRNQRKVIVRILRINQTIHSVTTTLNLTNGQ